MENQESIKVNHGNKNKIIMAVIGLIIVIASALLLSEKKNAQAPEQVNVISQQAEEKSEPADASTPINTEELKQVNIPEIGDAKVVVDGANPITADNKVVTASGKTTENAAMPMTENAPRQTGILDRENLAKGIVQLEIGGNKFSPKEFSTRAGLPTTFSLTSTDNRSHLISFKDPGLNAIAILVGPGQTKAITFNAPAKAGTYSFRCTSPNHADKGEAGSMIVK